MSNEDENSIMAFELPPESLAILSKIGEQMRVSMDTTRKIFENLHMPSFDYSPGVDFVVPRSNFNIDDIEPVFPKLFEKMDENNRLQKQIADNTSVLPLVLKVLETQSDNSEEIKDLLFEILSLLQCATRDELNKKASGLREKIGKFFNYSDKMTSFINLINIVSSSIIPILP